MASRSRRQHKYSFFAFALAHQLNMHLEPRDEKLCDFCVASVYHLSSGRVVRARLQPFVTVEGHRFNLHGHKHGSRFRKYRCGVKNNGNDCDFSLLVPIASAEEPECAAIVIREHRHQRVSKR